MNAIGLKMEGIVKDFPGVRALDHVDFIVNRGEIHGLLGENGAGKTTLMSVLCGLYRAEAGNVYLHDSNSNSEKEVVISTPRDAIVCGVGMVHQHFRLVQSQTVLENCILGIQGSNLVVDYNAIENDIIELGKKYGMEINPEAYIWELSVGEQQRVEILKMLYRDAEILIMDEPTAVLTPQEARLLGETMKLMAIEDKTIVFITHKLDEVIEFTHRSTVLRDGKNVSTVDTGNTTKRELANLMVGRDVVFSIVRPNISPGDYVMEMRGVSVYDSRGVQTLKDIDIDVKSGEILGVAGVSGNGQKELAEVATGLVGCKNGSIYIGGRDMSDSSAGKFIKAGVSHIPGDRIGVGLVGNLPVSDNLILKSYQIKEICGGLLFNQRFVHEYVDRLIDEYEVVTPGRDTLARNLSGGNQQKMVLAREIESTYRCYDDTRLIVAVYPTRGLDVGATEFVRSRLVKQCSEGAGILMVSDDLEEIIAISTRIAVMYSGYIVDVVKADCVTLEDLGMLMAGERPIDEI